MTISNACENLPIRGKFVIHLDDEDRTFLDWTHMSVYLLHEFLDIVKALTSPGSNESDAQKSELAVKTSMNHLLDGNLAELSSTISFASLRTKCEEPWKTNSRLRQYLSNNGTDIATNACQYLDSLKARAPRSKRACYFGELLRVNGVYSPGGPCNTDFNTLITHLFSYLEQIKNSWVLVTRWITSTQLELLQLNHETGTKALQFARSGAAASDTTSGTSSNQKRGSSGSNTSQPQNPKTPWRQ